MNQVQVEFIRILLVEDDEADILLAQRAFKRANIWNRMDVVRNGREALDYLYNEGDFTDRAKYPQPGLILLDLNLPGIDGRDVLDKLHKTPHMKTIPVVIISTSDYKRDIEFGRAREVQHYLIKPIQVDNVMEAFASIRSFKIILGNVAPSSGPASRG
jgi:CheY-like chemotaxis protein